MYVHIATSSKKYEKASFNRYKRRHKGSKKGDYDENLRILYTIC